MSHNGKAAKRSWGAAERLEFRRRITKAGCWVWQGCLNNGYGFLTVDKKGRYAHRLAWETWVGPIPADLQIDHLCRNRACFNPEHLEPVTPKVNTLRGMSSGAIANRIGTCRLVHPRDLWGYKHNARVYCRLCQSARSRMWNDGVRNIDLAAAFSDPATVRAYRLNEYVIREDGSYALSALPPIANINAAKTECKHGHPFDDENTYFRKDRTGRQCRQCARDSAARSYRRAAA